MMEVRSERSSTLTAVDLGNLIATKTAVRDDYYRSRDRVEKARDASMQDIVAKKKQYDRLAARVAAAESSMAKVGSHTPVTVRRKPLLFKPHRFVFYTSHSFICMRMPAP